MYNLYGVRTEHEYGYGGWTGREDEVKELLATFDSKELAEEYVKNSTLKAAQKPGFYPDIHRGKYRFRKGSTLRLYEFYEIESSEMHEVPHNPTV